MIEVFYKPSEIYFSREQVCWLIENRGMLLEGKWPPEHVETGYTGQNSKSRGHSAPFETPLVHIAEVTDRLDIRVELECRLTAARVDGKLLIAEIDAGKAIPELSYEARTVLSYISGWKRKKMDYSSYRKQWRYRHKYDNQKW